jgi:hypothetical protein
MDVPSRREGIRAALAASSSNPPPGMLESARSRLPPAKVYTEVGAGSWSGTPDALLEPQQEIPCKECLMSSYLDAPFAVESFRTSHAVRSEAWLQRAALAERPQPDSEPLEEALVVDGRAGISPAQLVERKLRTMLDGKSLSVSQLRTEALSSRSHGRPD